MLLNILADCICKTCFCETSVRACNVCFTRGKKKNIIDVLMKYIMII